MPLAHNKAVILAYHRVPASQRPAKFYDVPFDQFREQMKLVAQRRKPGVDPHIYITFDDGTDDHAAAGELLHELGLSGVFFIITDRLDQSGYLTRLQVARLAEQGHRIGSHGVSHRHFSSLSMSELDNELTGSRRFLEDLVGATVDWIAPPGGVYNHTVLERALALGYRVFRTSDWEYASYPVNGRVGGLPVLRHYPLATFERILDGRAPLWRYKLKNALKTVIGKKMYVAMRDRFTSSPRRS
jgi:peptidoglycan/xylan/chitin deacetylase (PgdA/CDA1 family)